MKNNMKNAHRRRKKLLTAMTLTYGAEFASASLQRVRGALENMSLTFASNPAARAPRMRQHD
eukprot:8706378-Prorocentrum_lima.AAC.1